jgi:4-amino-4-deoxy-L-arabinose transferase-like glycosyltransferase
VKLTIGRRFISVQLQVLLAISAVICMLGVLLPDSSLIPFHKELEISRASQVATQATRWLFLSVAVVCALTFAAWQWIQQTIAYAFQSIARLSNNTYWALIGMLAIGLRLPLLLLFPIAELRSDSLWSHNTALAIDSGEGLQVSSGLTAYRPPGYSALIGFTYRLLGPHPELAWFWGIASIGVILLTTYRLAYRLYGKSIARTATLIVAFYPALILYTGQLISDLVFTAGCMLVFYVVVLHTPYRWLETTGIGVALGLLTLTRGVSIGLFLIVPLIWFIKEANIRKLVIHFVLLTCVFTVCLTPWMVRNYKIFSTPTLSTNMGFNLYVGNHAGASGAYDIAVVPAALETNRPLNEAQIDRIYLQSAIHFIIARPIDASVLIPKKIIQLFLPEVTAAQSLFQDQPYWLKYSFYGVSQIFYLPILALFALRLLNFMDASTRPHGMQWTGIIVTLYFTLMAILFFGLDRYRLPFLPWMIIESSVVLSWLVYRQDVRQL